MGAGLIALTLAGVVLLQHRWLSPVAASPSALVTTAPAPSPHSLTAAASPALTPVVGLGDSVLSPASCGCDGMLADYAQLISSALGYPVTSINVGRSGATTSTLLEQLRQEADTRAAVHQAGSIVIIIGANDLAGLDCPDLSCYQAPVEHTVHQLEEILHLTSALRAHPTTPVLVLTYWNVSIDGEVALHQLGDQQVRLDRQVTQLLNAGITRTAEAAGAVAVNLYDPFITQTGGNPTGLLAPDGDHPNAAGAHAIAAALWKATPPTWLN